MATKILQGTLLDAAGAPLGLATIRFVATSTRSIVNSITTDFPVSGTGAYNISLAHGVYTVQIKRAEEVSFRTVCANAYIASSGTSTLEDVIKEQSLIQEADDTVIARMLQILSQTTAQANTATSAVASVGESVTVASNAAQTATVKAQESKDAATTAQAAASSAASSSTTAQNAVSTINTAATTATNAANTATSKALEASNSAAAAATSSTSASTSATNAANSATAAGTSASNAANSATNASTSATNAATSATAADTSATVASSKADAASASATLASSKADAASTSATNASTSATNAAASATTAGTSATAASVSATNASNQATAAATSAQAAATSASNAVAAKDFVSEKSTLATNAASAASASASTASSKADAASASATSADSSAILAANKADIATSKALDASNSAVTAASSSTTATQAATDAATSATSVGDQAAAAAASAASAVAAKDFVSEQTVLATNAATSASASATIASSKADAASMSATSADASAILASDKASAAATSASSAASIVTQVESKAAEANQSALDAAASASEAAISATLASGALIEAGSTDLSLGVYPTPIKDSLGNNRSCFWKVVVGGTVGTENYGVGDSLVYSRELSGYYKLDNTEAVSSVNGKQGIVVLTANDLNLGQVDNTSDLNKPISTATANALSSKAPISHIGSVGEEHHGLASQTLAGFMSSTDKIKLDNMSEVSGVSSVNSKTGEVVLTKADVGLGLVNNTADLDKPISTATQAALDSKYSPTNKPTASDVGLGLVNNTADLDKPISNATQTALASKADTNHVHGVVTTSVAGFMSAADKTKLDGISGAGTGDQTITLTGDVTGSGTGSFATTLANSGVTAGTYNSVTVDAKGRVTAGSNPTTLAGYGITDAAAASHTHTIIGFSDTRSENFNPTSYQGLSLHLKLNTTDGLDDGGGYYHGVLNLMSWNDYSGGRAHQLGFTDNGNMHIRSTADGTTFSSWGKVWTSLNDGAGSGLDADLLDGLSSTSTNTASTVVTRDNSGNFSAGTITAALSGNASTATTLQTARTIATSGDATGTATSFNGSANITIPLTLANTGVTAGTYKSITVDTKGRVTSGTNPTTLAEYGITDATPSSHIGSTGASHGLATTSVAGFMSAADKTKLDGLGSGGVATTADKLTTPRLINGTSFDGTSNISTANWGTSRSISIGGTAKTVDGSSNVSWSTSELGCLPLTGGTLSGSLSVQGTIYAGISGYPQRYCSLYVTDNIATITAGPEVKTGFQVKKGSSTYFLVDESGEVFAGGTYRVYHTNNKPTATDVGLGNVNNTSDLNKPISTATQAALDGKSATTHTHTAADVGALASTGTAVAATKLATARTIAGKSFDGTANISIAAADVGALSTGGGTLSGGLNVGDAIKLTNSSSVGLLNSFGRTLIRGSTGPTNVLGNPTDAMYFDGNSLTALQFRYNNTLYPIYHTGNKPTPAEIGAQPATSDIRVKSNITSLPPVLDKIMLIDPKTFTMEGREGTCVGTIAQDWEADFPEVILNVPSTSQGEPEMLKGIDALGTIGILLKAIQELKAEVEELKNR